MSRRAVTGGLALTSLLAGVLLAGCGNPPYPRGSLTELYPLPPRPQLLQQSVDDGALHWAQLGRGERPLVFIHGSPGEWKAWARYLDHPNLADYAPRIAVDRPGFGDAAREALMPDLRAQAKRLIALLPAESPSILVGHSLGGPLVAWMALEAPQQVCGGVIVAGALAPELEAPRWYNRIAEWPGLRALLPAELRRANAEMLPLQAELERLQLAWPRLNRPLLLLQGMRDELVDPRTAERIAQRPTATPIRVQRFDDAGHFLLWTHPERVIAAIRSLPC